MKKRYQKCLGIICAICAVGLFAFTGCGDQKKEEKDWLAKQNGVQRYEYSEESGDDALRVLLDIRDIAGTDTKQALYEFSQQLEKYYGLTDVVFEWIPTSGSEREAIIGRLKVEIMSGDGPDVYIVQPSGARSIEDEEGNYNPLFPYPEKVMEAGVFLPLDHFIESHTVLTDWSKQQQTVLSAGRNTEGQQIVPLTYSFPVLCYPQDTIQVNKPDELVSWEDIVDNTEWSSLYGGLIDCGIMTEYGPGSFPYFDFVLGKIADFETEKLLFTEEELLQRVNEINSLPLLEEPEETIWIEDYIGSTRINKNYPVTMLPLYSDDGGITVSIDAFAAVNRNSQRPDDAYAVIDVLMSEYMQQNSSLYAGWLLNICGSIPMNEELYQETKPLKEKGYLIGENFTELMDIRDQITGANYHDALAQDLHVLLMQSRNPEAYGQTVEDIVHQAYELIQRKVRE